MNAIIFSQYSFSLTPKILNAIDMIFALGKFCRMVNPIMMKLAYIKRIIPTPRVGVDNAIWFDFTGNNGHQRSCLGIWNHDRANPSLAF